MRSLKKPLPMRPKRVRLPRELAVRAGDSEAWDMPYDDDLHAQQLAAWSHEHNGMMVEEIVMATGWTREVVQRVLASALRKVKRAMVVGDTQVTMEDMLRRSP
jgi:hypothetical protein